MADVALALGGGGVKGIAHIGVIRRLEEEGFTIRAVAGTSAGGLIGAAYAAGASIHQIEDFVEHISRNKLFSRAKDDGASLLGLSGLADGLSRLLKDCRFEDMRIPFACTAVDLKTAQEVILSQGRVLDSVMATIAVPGVFPPREMGDATLIDGAVLDPVPVALARWLAPSLPVIAVVLSPVPEGWRHLQSSAHSLLPGKTHIPSPILEQFSRLRLAQAFEIFTRSIDITSLMLSELRLQLEKPEAVIRPAVDHYGMLDMVDPHEMIWLGEKAASEAIPQIQHSLVWHRRISRRLRRVDPPGRFYTEPKSPHSTTD